MFQWNKATLWKPLVSYSNDVADLINRFRLVPRLVLLAMGYAFYDFMQWFYEQSDLTNAQSAIGVALVGGVIGLCKFYFETGAFQKNKDID